MHYNHNFCLQSQSHSAVIKPRFHELIGKMRKKFQMPILDANQSISSIGVNGVSSEIEDAEKLHGLWKNELRTVQSNSLNFQIWPIDLDFAKTQGLYKKKKVLSLHIKAG